MKTSELAVLFVTFTLSAWVACATAADAPVSPQPLAASPAEIPLNRQATADAWAAFRAGQLALAISKADKCIDRYQPAADGIQSMLDKEKTDLPTGAVLGAERQRSDRYQILHDVATCLLIKAWITEEQGRKGDAIKAYAKVKKYSHARATERPGEPLWSPAENASQHLSRLTQ